MTAVQNSLDVSKVNKLDTRIRIANANVAI